MRNYMKKKKNSINLGSVLACFLASGFFEKYRKPIFMTLSALFILPISLCIVSLCTEHIGVSEVADIQFEDIPVAAASVRRGVIAIPEGVAKKNPFLPYNEVNAGSKVNDVPEYTLVEPPDMLDENSEAARVMDTIVSGIMYDRYSPSAILNIEGNDYLVKKGDVVNNYKVLSITEDSVTVKMGNNVYKAGIGEIITGGVLRHNEVANLDSKFGGEKR